MKILSRTLVPNDDENAIADVRDACQVAHLSCWLMIEI